VEIVLRKKSEKRGESGLKDPRFGDLSRAYFSVLPDDDSSRTLRVGS